MSGSWSPTALPDANDVPQLEDPRGYEKVLAIERRYSSELGDLPTRATVSVRVVLETSIMYLRVIGWCYVYLHLSCRPSLTRWVLSSEDDSTVVDLGRFLCQHYLRACTFLLYDVDQAVHTQQSGRTRVQLPPIVLIHLAVPSIAVATLLNAS